MKYCSLRPQHPILIALLLLTLVGCQIDKKGNSNNTKRDLYKPYSLATQKSVANLSPERLQTREKAVTKLKNTETYKKLVDSSLVTPEYLPLFTAINSGIRGSYFNEIDEEIFTIDKTFVDRITKSENGEDKMDFVINTVLLSLPNKGGIPQDIIEVFERYRVKYKFYGLPSKFHDMNGKLISSVEHPYNLSSIFGLIDPENRKAIEAIYEANEKNISDWLNDREKGSYINSYTATIADYVDFLSKNHKRSEYLPDEYSDNFWDNYDAEVKRKIIEMIYLKNCKGLQEQFNIAEQNMDSRLARTGTGNSELMGFIDENMRKIGCYDN